MSLQPSATVHRFPPRSRIPRLPSARWKQAQEDVLAGMIGNPSLNAHTPPTPDALWTSPAMAELGRAARDLIRQHGKATPAMVCDRVRGDDDLLARLDKLSIYGVTLTVAEMRASARIMAEEAERLAAARAVDTAEEAIEAAKEAIERGEDPRAAVAELRPLFEPGTGAAGAAGDGGLSAVWADDIEPRLDEAGLVDGLLSATGMTVLYGESGAGKTFVALDLACHVAAGLAWNGMAVERGVVVYVAAEAPASVERRVVAWKARHGVDRLPVLVVRSAVNLLDGDTDRLLALLAEVEASRGRVALVVVDTLARAMVGNENAPEDMGAFVAACGRIREATRGHVLVVHHSGKDAARGARGHSCLRAATDVELEVTGADGAGCVRVSKSRDEAGARAFGFRLEVVELGVNAKGRTVTTCVAAEAEPPTGPTTPGKAPILRPNQQVVLDALGAAVVDKGGRPPEARDIPPEVKVVTHEEWRDTAVRYLPQAELKDRTQAFKRAVESLTAGRHVRHAGGYFWLPAQGGHAGHAGHIRPDVAERGRTQASGHTGHTATHPFRGVAGVAVADEGRGAEGDRQGGQDR